MFETDAQASPATPTAFESGLHTTDTMARTLSYLQSFINCLSLKSASAKEKNKTKQNKNKNKQQLWCTFNWYFSMVSKVVSIKNKNA